jgi:integrase
MTQSKKALFIPAKIYQADDVKAKWFVFYSYWSEAKLPEPGYERFKVYEDKSMELRKGNKILIQSKKVDYFNKLATHVNNQLSKGWSPFGDNYARRLNSDFISIDQSLTNVIKYKKSFLADTAFKSFQSHIKGFQAWLVTENISYFKCGDIGKKHVVEFLYTIQAKNKLTNRTINNYLIDISSGYTMMKELEYISINPCEDIAYKPAKSEKHRLYNDILLAQISEYMQETNPYLQLFCKFIWMGFRPIEIVRLKVSDICLFTNIISLAASNEKTGDTKYRNVLELFRPHILEMNLDQYPGSYYLFSAKKQPDIIGTTRDYFTDKFKDVKDHFELPSYFTMYGLRHTMAVALVRAKVPFPIIMKITGHTTLQAFQNYIQQYMDEVPAEDVSLQFKLTI